MTTQSEVSKWFEEGKKDKQNSYMLVVCDTFSYEDYPVFSRTLSSCRKKFAEYSKNMQRVIEIYDLKAEKAPQLKRARAWIDL